MAENPSPVSGDEENDGADALRAALNRCRQPLRDLMPAPQDNEGFARSRRPAVPVAVPPERLPVPHSVALVMSLVLGAHDLGRRDKLMWEYPFTYRGRPCSIALEKFGLRLYLGLEDSSLREDSTIADKTVEAELVSKISKATRCVENKVLSNIANEQGKAGRITIGNQASQLRQMYEYFRDRASDAYAGPRTTGTYVRGANPGRSKQSTGQRADTCRAVEPAASVGASAGRPLHDSRYDLCLL